MSTLAGKVRGVVLVRVLRMMEKEGMLNDENSNFQALGSLGGFAQDVVTIHFLGHHKSERFNHNTRVGFLIRPSSSATCFPKEYSPFSSLFEIFSATLLSIAIFCSSMLLSFVLDLYLS